MEPVTTTPLGVGVIGAGWMGNVHARSVARVRHHYPELPLHPTVVAVSDTLASHVAQFRAQHGPVRSYPDWRDLVADPEVGLVCVTAPNAFHAEMGTAVAQAGKHLWIEKPVGLTAADAALIRDAVNAQGVMATVGFNYRNLPMVERARALIAAGTIGTPTHASFRTLADYAAHPAGTLSWRYTIAGGGHGILADLGSHGFDLICTLLGEIDSLVADTATFLPRRPVAAPGASHFAMADLSDPDLPYGDVENEDYLSCLVRMRSGARVLYEAGRTSVGDQCNYGFVIHGATGSVAWDFRRSDELALCVGQEYQGQPTQTLLGSPGDGEYARFQPGAGIAMSYDDTKVIELARLLHAIAGGPMTGATLADACRAAQANEAVLASAASGAWARPGDAGH